MTDLLTEAGIPELTPLDQLTRRERLSGHQAHMLMWVLERYREIEDSDATGLLWRGGVRFPRFPAGVSRSESSATSRALRRLEDRGYLVRLNSSGGQPGEGYTTQIRTTHIRLTDTGRALAEQLTKAKGAELTGEAGQALPELEAGLAL